MAIVGTPPSDSRGPHHVPEVVSCSRYAWDLGVRHGMAASVARSIAPSIAIVGADPVLERDTARAIADAVLGLTETVDLGGRSGCSRAHLAMYAAVPPSVRGGSFGSRVAERLKIIDVLCRIGIADDRFTAWVAASRNCGSPVRAPSGAPLDRAVPWRAITVVPRGGAAAFLAPMPLTLLQIPLEVRHMLESLGIGTVGEFAALPAPSVAVRSGPFQADYQALARGEGSAKLQPYAPEGAICEELAVGASCVFDTGELLSSQAAVAQLARRIALRLEGRRCGATRLKLQIFAKAGAAGWSRDVLAASPLYAPEQLARVLLPLAVENSEIIRRLRVTVVEENSTASPCADLSVADDSGQLSPIHTVSVESHSQVAARAAASDDRSDSGPTCTTAATTVDPLALVLSTSGALLSLSSVKERGYRRTRRGKQRQFSLAARTQPRLFDQR